MALSGWCQHFSYPLGFPTFAMGSTLQGRRLFVLDRNEGLVSPFGSGTLVISWLALTPLSAASARPVPQGVLPVGPRCVRELRLSLASSSVLHCPMLGFSVAPTTLAAGLGLSWVPCPTFCRLGFCTSAECQKSSIYCFLLLYTGNWHHRYWII